MMGSAAYSLASIAAGRTDYYWEKGILLWDVAAGLALVEAAGGKILIQRIDQHCFEVMATNAYLPIPY